MQYREIIEKGLSLGIEELEVYATTKETNTLKVFNGQVETYNLSNLFSVSIRGLYQGKMGYVSTETVDEESIEELLKLLIENAKVLTSSEKDFIYDGSGKYLEVDEVVADYKEHSFEEKVKMLKDLESRALASDPRIVRVGYCQYVEVSTRVDIFNSKGVNLSRNDSYMYVVLGVLAVDGEHNAMGYAADANFKFSELETDRVLKEAVENALATLGAGCIETGSYEVVFRNDVATEILQAFSSVFSGEAAMRKMSILTDKIGLKVFGDNIQIVDDPLYPDALIKSSFDDEGVPCRFKKVVENGVFNGFLHSQKTAHFFGCEPTGNGAKTNGSIVPSPTNLVLLPGLKSRSELIKGVKKGIYVTEVAGLHAGLNPISGAFNVQASGHIIEDGKIIKPVTLFVVSGNFFEMFNDIKEIGNDIEKRFTGFASPTIHVNKLAVSGK